MDELIIQIIAALNKQLSKKQIKTDIKDLEKTPFYIKLIGRLNKSLTRNQIERDIQDVQNTANSNPIEINAEINSNVLQQSVNEALTNIEQTIQNNPINIDINANVDNVNVDDIIQVQQQTERQTQRILGDYVNAYRIFQRITQAIQSAVAEIEKLNKAEIDLQMITQKSANEVKALMQDYNDLAKKMGATTLEVTDGASEWLRQGKSISDTNTLIRDSMILSKISQMESSEATKHLTSAMNGFKLEASEVIGIVDKLNAVDLESASDAAGLAESLSRCANSANVAGISMDRLIAYIATVSEVTQKSASSVGEGFKSITARLQNIKVNKFIDEDGTDISGELSDAEKILNKFNITLRKNAKEFRDAQDVIDDVAKSWSNMSSVEQSAIASAFGTVHQRENVIALFENYNRVLELTEVSANSAGMAMEKFAVYEASLESATNRLTASLQGIAYNTIDSDFLKNLANGTAQIIELVDKTQLLKTGLSAGIFTGAITGLVALGTRMVAVRNNVAQFTQAMNISRQTTTITTDQYMALRANVQGLTEAQLRLVLSSRQLNEQQRLGLMQAAGIEQARRQQLLQTWNLTDAANAQTTATFSLRGAWEGLKASIISNPVGLIVAGLTTAVTVISTVKQRQEELRQTISDTAQTAKEQTDKLNDLISTYEKFANKVTYTTEEKEKLKSIQEQLVEAYHTEVDGIDLLNGKYDEQIKRLQQLKKEKLEEAELSLIAEREQAHKDASYGNLPQKEFYLTADWFKSDDDYKKIAEELKKRNTGFSNNIGLAQKAFGYDSAIYLYSGDANYRIKQIKETMEVLKEYGYANIGLYSELNKLLSDYQKLSDTENTAISNLAENKFQQYQINNPYDEKAGKDAYLSWKNGLIESAEGDTALQQELTNLAEKQFPDYQKYFDNIAELKAKYVDTTADASKAIAKMDFINALSIEDSQIATQIPDLFKNGLDGATKAIAEWKNNPDNQISVDVETSEIDTSSLEELQEAYDNLSKSAESYTKAQKTLTDSLKEQEEYGQLSASTIQSLTDAGYAQALSVNTETGAVTLNTEAYERLNNEKKQKLKLDLEQQNTDLQDKIKEEESTISSLKMEYEALAKANAEANAERLKEIEIELAAHSQDEARLRELVDKNNAAKIGLDAPTFEKSDNKDLWKEEAEKKFADLEHLYAMDKISYASYLNQMDKLNQHYYGNNEKYLDDFYKYEEKVYQGRKKLAEDLLEEEEKTKKAYHNNRISELEAKITVTTNDSIDDQGNKLNASEKFDYLRAIYDEILTEIERRENEIVQSGVEGHEDELAELAKKYEEYANKKADMFKDEIQYEIDYISELEKKYDDFINKRIDRYEDEKKAIEDRYDSEIKAIEQTIDSLKDKNNEAQNALNLKKAEQDLEKSRQRTRMTYGSDGTITYKQDDEAIAEAQQKVDDIKLDMIVSNLEQQKKTLEEAKTTEVDKYDDMITALNEQKDTQEKYFQTLIEILNNYSNPKASENIKSVWDRIFADKENVTVKDTTVNVKGTEVSTSSAVFGEIDSDKVNKTLDKANEVIENLKEDKARNVVNSNDATAEILRTLGIKIPDGRVDDFIKKFSWNSNSYNPAQTVIDAMNNNIRQITQSANVKPSVNVGNLSLNIQTPVGTIEDIAKHAATGVVERAEREMLMQLPNAFMRQMYTNLK